jgi:hypothetical protein
MLPVTVTMIDGVGDDRIGDDRNYASKNGSVTICRR